MATASFVAYLETPRELRVLGFRAPPPSPVTGVLSNGGSGSPEYGECPDGNEDDEVGRFLRRSARVPVLRLPERDIPRKKKNDKAVWAPPVIDMRLLATPDTGGLVVETLRSAAVAFGCFQVVGHGVNECLVSAAAGRASSPTPEEAGGEDDEDGEELWWSPSEGDQLRNGADDLFTQLEQTAAKLMDALRDSVGATDSLAGADTNGSLLCIRTHHRRQCDGGSGSVGPITISQDAILRMLIKSSRRPRALALHLCPGASTFHVFSRQRGRSRFRPLGGAVVVTVGDQLQAWSSGLYKSVAGKPAYSDGDLRADRGCDVVWAEYLHSCSSASMESDEPLDADAGKIIQLNVQIMVAASLVLLYHFLLSCSCTIWS
ncbi:hypothetical protein CFC21_047922 [Triticum aestivum]|uniref:Non-haem dioxygenase N-terminal domain-containing protein n=3 Tax=Triticinae TaxID=1648030 RepID=A0A453FEX1_AEGTS|nr:uncharacterized protein LOC109784402 [Aegilops tauschii subsp. strangulata]XP_044357650.1 uncharacterized protein LOC123079045 [Triticum aestivum]KAF7037573.1 hypothetical protein CFC21_047922 [Triticum aestivum]